jgi:hypothetical protein
MRPADLTHVLLGRRTGFAFADGSRKILIGVFGPNADENNHLDGPFDQLPDNFIEGDALKDALLASRPDLTADAIDRYGNHRGEETRELIAPYMEYYAPEDLEAADRCLAEARDGPAYECLEKIGGE